MKCQIVVTGISLNNVSAVIIKIDDHPLVKKLTARFKLHEEVFEDFYDCLKNNSMLVTIMNNVIIEAEPPKDDEEIEIEQDFSIMDSSDVIKYLIQDAGGKLEKHDLYDQYCKLTGKSSRTAQDHLQEAMNVIPNLVEDGYYAVKLIEVKSEEKADKEKVKDGENKAILSHEKEINEQKPIKARKPLKSPANKREGTSKKEIKAEKKK